MDGAEWVGQYLYFRNLMIYRHLSTLIQKGHERILVIMNQYI
ncbi:DUF5694 domain-containing protein [Shouchella patagoniensis]